MMGKSFFEPTPRPVVALPLLMSPTPSGSSGCPEMRPSDGPHSRDEPDRHGSPGRRAVTSTRGDISSGVVGPLGERLTREGLPSGTNLRWVARRKAQVVAAVEGGLLSAREACTRYNLSAEELASWRQIYGEEGLQGLRLRQIDVHRSDRKRKRKKH